MGSIKELLERLSNAHGVSGYEGNVGQLIEDEVRPYVDEIKTDKMGNLIATKHGGSPAVMLAAHMDEIGLMVKYVDDKGFVHFTRTGGWFDQALLNKRMILHTGKGPAVTVSDAEGRGIIVPEPVLKWLREAAGSNNIPYQLKVGTGGTTDASAIHLSHEGVPAGVISAPS